MLCYCTKLNLFFRRCTDLLWLFHFTLLSKQTIFVPLNVFVYNQPKTRLSYDFKHDVFICLYFIIFHNKLSWSIPQVVLNQKRLLFHNKISIHLYRWNELCICRVSSWEKGLHFINVISRSWFDSKMSFLREILSKVIQRN